MAKRFILCTKHDEVDATHDRHAGAITPIPLAAVHSSIEGSICDGSHAPADDVVDVEANVCRPGKPKCNRSAYASRVCHVK